MRCDELCTSKFRPISGYDGSSGLVLIAHVTKRRLLALGSPARRAELLIVCITSRVASRRLVAAVCSH